MIPITPEIMGPGIEEEYADALAAIRDLRRALGPRPLTNSTPDGRVLLEIAWLEQEIDRRMLPIPVDRSYAGTVYYLTGSGELNHVPGVDATVEGAALQRLYVVLQGIGLLKPRHVPVLIATIDDLTADARACAASLTTEEHDLLKDLAAQVDLLRSGQWPAYRPPAKQFGAADAPNLDSLVPRYFYRVRDIDSSLFEGWRPIAARKPPLPAPNPSLPLQAPPLPPDLEGRLP